LEARSGGGGGGGISSEEATEVEKSLSNGGEEKPRWGYIMGKGLTNKGITGGDSKRTVSGKSVLNRTLGGGKSAL